ncbi:DUF423 domain-containing protein [Paludisphaera sp.]|uniref:DUF423 domain-containing protein n=1 Tax=Paludisphaera sp. TaxID=2017432 RepID=UPI00301CC571
MQDGFWLRAGAAWGFLGVAIGAFGAHALKPQLEAAGKAASFQTGVDYHIYMALALVAVGILQALGRPGPALHLAGWMFLAGGVLFSGSIYALALTSVKGIWWVTPTGGLLILAGWAALAVAAGSVGRPAADRAEAGAGVVAAESR